MSYTKQTWRDLPEGGTQIDAAALTHMEDGIFAAVDSSDLDGSVAAAVADPSTLIATALIYYLAREHHTGTQSVSTITGLAPVATSGGYADLTGRPLLALVATSGAYADLSGRPTLATVAGTGLYNDLTGKPSLSTVATSGAYADLSGLPTLYTDEAARDALGAALVAGNNVTVTVDDPGNTITVAATPAPGVMLVVQKDPTTGFWPSGWTAAGLPIYTGGSASAGVRPTARTDITVAWKGPDPSPGIIVSAGTAGMLNPVDVRFVTP